MRSRSGRFSPGRIVIGIALVAGALTWSAAPAFAHNSFLSADPAPGSVVTEQPGTITVTTNDDLLNLGGSGSGMAMQISGPGADTPLYYGDGCVTVSGPSVETQAQLGQPGEYTVVWQVVSTDGHPVSGTFTFSWQPAAGQVLADGSSTAPTCGRAAPASAEPSPAPSATPAAEGQLRDALWIGGAGFAALLAVALTLVVVTRRRPGPAPDSAAHDDSRPPTE